MIIDGNVFCGYYDYSPINADEELILLHKTTFIDKFPNESDECEIIIFNLLNQSSYKIDRTTAWNWQQGSRLQWLGPDFKNKIIYNKFIDKKLKSIIRDINSKEEKVIDHPIYSICKNGTNAACYDFSRVANLRQSYSYANLIKNSTTINPKAGNGVISINLDSGEYNTIVSIEDLIKIKPLSSMKSGSHWVDTPFISPSGKTIFFLHRWTTDNKPNGGFYSRIFSVDFTGKNLSLILDSGTANHMTVLDDENIIFDGVNARSLNRFKKYKILNLLFKIMSPFYQNFILKREAFRQSLINHYYYSLSKITKKTKIEIKSLVSMGHPSISPVSKNYFFADTYEDTENYRHLYLCNRIDQTYKKIESFYSQEKYNGEYFRADLHPKWNVSGNKVIIDIIQNDERKVIVKDVNNFF